MFTRKILIRGVTATILMGALLPSPANSDNYSTPLRNVTAGGVSSDTVTIANPVVSDPNAPVTPMISYSDFRTQLSASNGAALTKGVAPAIGQIEVNPVQMAGRMIGATVIDNSGKLAGSIEDVTMDPKGMAQKFIVQDDSGILGFKNKSVAVAYKALDRDPSSTNRTLFKIVDQSLLKGAIVYAKSADKTSLNFSQLRGAALKSPTKQTLGQIEDVVVENGKATMLIVSFNQVIGASGNKAVMNFSDASIITNGGSSDYVQLTARQADMLTALKTIGK